MDFETNAPATGAKSDGAACFALFNPTVRDCNPSKMRAEPCCADASGLRGAGLGDGSSGVAVVSCDADPVTSSAVTSIVSGERVSPAGSSLEPGECRPRSRRWMKSVASLRRPDRVRRTACAISSGIGFVIAGVLSTMLIGQADVVRQPRRSDVSMRVTACDPPGRISRRRLHAGHRARQSRQSFRGQVRVRRRQRC